MDSDFSLQCHHMWCSEQTVACQAMASTATCGWSCSSALSGSPTNSGDAPLKAIWTHLLSCYVIRSVYTNVWLWLSPLKQALTVQLLLTHWGEPWNQSPKSSREPLKWSSLVCPGRFICCMNPLTESWPRWPLAWMDLALRSQCQTVEFLSACFWTRILSSKLTCSFLDKRVRISWSKSLVFVVSIRSKSSQQIVVRMF